MHKTEKTATKGPFFLSSSSVQNPLISCFFPAAYGPKSPVLSHFRAFPAFSSFPVPLFSFYIQTHTVSADFRYFFITAHKPSLKHCVPLLSVSSLYLTVMCCTRKNARKGFLTLFSFVRQGVRHCVVPLCHCIMKSPMRESAWGYSV